MPRMIAAKKIRFDVLETLPADVNAATAVELNAGQNASCLVGAAGFNLGAGSPTTTNDGALCEGQNVQVPVEATYEGSMTVYRFFNSNGQINVTEDWLFQAVKEFGSQIIAAVRDGGKAWDEEWEDGDEYSLYEITVAGAGRDTERAGWSKRPLNITVRMIVEDAWVGGTAPTAP